MHRLLRWLLWMTFAAAFAVGAWHFVLWQTTYQYWSNQYVGGMINHVITLERLKANTDPGDVSLSMIGVCPDVFTGYTPGQVLDVMVQSGRPRRVGILERAALEKHWFARDLCLRRGLKPPVPGSRTNDVLSPEDFDLLAQAAAIYREHFTSSVVGSGDYERQRRALVEVHLTLQRTGLDQVLGNPPWLDQGF